MIKRGINLLNEQRCAEVTSNRGLKIRVPYWFPETSQRLLYLSEDVELPSGHECMVNTIAQNHAYGLKTTAIVDRFKNAVKKHNVFVGYGIADIEHGETRIVFPRGGRNVVAGLSITKHDPVYSLTQH